MITLEELKKVTIGTLSRQAPFDRCFNDDEAQHILDLLTRRDGSISLDWKSRDGSDGETYSFFGIRRRDGSVPKSKKVRYVYESLVYMRFLAPPSSAVRLLESLKEAGVEVSSL